MSKPTLQERLDHKSFLRRQKIYENKYQKRFYRLLQLINKDIANAIEEEGLTVNITPYLRQNALEMIYEALYKQVTLNEAELQFKAFDEMANKDIIDNLASIFSNENSIPINLWRRLLNEFITTRIAGRITEVTNTTRKRIAVLIERGISEGLGAREVAKIIREDTSFNKNRSLAIARTETITSANQGKYMAAHSSQFKKQKKWLPTNDARTRPSHLDFFDRPYIDMEQMFFVANANGFLEEARFPCDNTLSASNTINCRCSVIFRNKLDENGNPIRRGRFETP